MIPGARLTITSTATNIGVAVVANDEGLYVAPGLLPGGYRVTVQAVGVGKLTKSGIQLEINFGTPVLNVNSPQFGRVMTQLNSPRRIKLAGASASGAVRPEGESI